MKKRIFMLAVLILSGLQFAVAAIDEQLRALITTSSDVEVTEVTNDEANPWTVADGMASSTVGKIYKEVSSTITIKFRAKGRTTITHDYTFDPYSSYDYRKVYIDGVEKVSSYNTAKTKKSSILFLMLDEGEHELKFTHKHYTYTYDTYSQVFSVGNICIRSVESQYMTINLSAPGTLGVEALSLVSTLPEMHYLRLTGTMNSDDWNTISNMTGLYAIDMSGVDVKDFPKDAFYTTSLCFIDFPPTLKSIGEDAFYNRALTGPLVLPEGLDSIAINAFYRNYYITELVIPSSVRTIGKQAFSGCSNLKSLTLGSGLKEIKTECFYDCSSLETIEGGENVENIYSRAFYNCRSLKNVGDIIPMAVYTSAFNSCSSLASFNFSRIKSIGNEAFRSCKALKEVDLTTITSLSYYSFDDCSGIKKITIGDNLKEVQYHAFSNCDSIDVVVIGSSVIKLGTNSFNSSRIKSVYITAPAPPAVDSTPFYSPTSITLYVPDYAMVSYKLDDYWSKFTKVEPNPNTPDKVNLYKKLELTSNARIPNSPDIFIGTGGALIVNGDNPQTFGKYTQYMTIADNTSASLINRCKQMTSSSSQFNFYLGSGYWYYLCMPFDVKRSDIILPKGTSLAVRYYDSESRATNGASGNWKDVSADAVLQTGKGYIFRLSSSGNVGFPATEETHNAIFRSKAITTPLVQYPAVESANAGWNFVGNPYPCFYDIYYMDFAAPITTWDVDNSTYKAYSAADDEFVLSPQQAFFVQKPELVDAITFQPAGRQINKTIDHSALAKRRAASNKQVQRKLVDVSLTCADRTDRTRVVVNANASDDFCADNDAVKMMAYEGTPQIYTIAGADQLAVNEGAHRGGSVALGMYLPADDTYTIAVDRDELGAKLLDYGVEVEMPYTFSAAEGYADDRFTITFETSTTGINTVATDAKTDDAIYTIDGRRVNSTAQKGIYIQNHKKIVK